MGRIDNKVHVPEKRKAQMQAAAAIYRSKGGEAAALWDYLEAIIIDEDPQAIASMRFVLRADEADPGEFKQTFKLKAKR